MPREDTRPSRDADRRRLARQEQAGLHAHVDTGDFVVVVNAEKIAVTGQKLDQKLYHRHSGYPGGLRTRTLRTQLERRPTEVLRKAVKGMLPRNRLARQQITKLKIYAGPTHLHEAQAPSVGGLVVAEQAQYLGTGKRKTPVACVILRPGDGKTWFNGRTLEDYFPRMTHRVAALAPLKTAGVEGTFDIRVRVHGGGRPARQGRSGTASPARSSRPTRSCGSRSSGSGTRDAARSSARRPGLQGRARRRSSKRQPAP